MHGHNDQALCIFPTVEWINDTHTPCLISRALHTLKWANAIHHNLTIWMDIEHPIAWSRINAYICANFFTYFQSNSWMSHTKVWDALPYAIIYSLVRMRGMYQKHHHEHSYNHQDAAYFLRYVSHWWFVSCDWW